MSKGGNSSGNGNSKSILVTFIIVILAVGLVGGGYLVFNGDTKNNPLAHELEESSYDETPEDSTTNSESSEQDITVAENTAEESPESAPPSAETEQSSAEENTETEEAKASDDATPEDESVEEAATETKTDDHMALENLAKPRIMGDKNAPVKLTEHASFTCPHCADFHKNVLKKIKTNYIDTGKAYLEFSDFPTNYPAVHASMVARCVPDKNYFNFVRLLFETQDEWARKANYKEILKQDALIAGLDEKTFEKCINNKDLEKALLNKVEEAHNRHGISSVPSIIINNTKVVAGAQPYENFVKEIEAALSQASQPQE